MMKIAKLDEMKPNKYQIIKNVIIFTLIVIFVILIILPEGIFQEPSIMGAVLASVRIVATNAPTFDFNLTNQTINESALFYLDVNCSDADLLDTVVYYDNFTGFDVN